MNLTPANWKKSEVTENKQFVTVGMKLYATHASDKGIVIERAGDEILFQSDDDLNGEWNEWYNLNDLQLGWQFTNKDREYIEAVNAHGYYEEEFEQEVQPAPVVATAPGTLSHTLTAILATPLPAFRANIRRQTRKEWAVAVRKLLKDIGVKGVSVTTPSYSMAQSIHITLPPALDNPNSIEHQEFHNELWKNNRPGTDCPHCGQRWNARNHIEAIILAAFPDLNNRSEAREDYFDYCLSID